MSIDHIASDLEWLRRRLYVDNIMALADIEPAWRAFSYDQGAHWMPANDEQLGHFAGWLVSKWRFLGGKAFYERSEP